VGHSIYISGLNAIRLSWQRISTGIDIKGENMKHSRTKLLLLALVMVFIVGGSVGCNGIDHGNYHRNPLAYKVHSKNSTFDVNDVTLDFSYGRQGSIDGTINGGGSSVNRLVCFALYFCDGQYYWQTDQYGHALGVNGYTMYEDYRDIDNWYYVKEISIDIFRSDAYLFEFNFAMGCIGSTKFNHQESLTVPKEVFEREKGTLVFQIVGVNTSKEAVGYCVCKLGCLVIAYEYIDENTVRLSAPDGSVPR